MVSRNLCRSVCGSVYGVLVILFLTGPIAVGSVFEWNLLGVLTVYGTANLLHYLIQFVSALLNRRRIERIPKPRSLPPFGIVVVGYQEDAYYFRKCLEKIKDMEGVYPSLKRIWIIQDGEEKYMTDIVRDVFQDSDLLTLNLEPYYELSELQKNLTSETMRDRKIICIEQKHRGKRDAMFTAFQASIYLGDIQYILCTDSDTWISRDAPEELLKLTDDDVGAITGHVRIFNIKNLLALLIELKYYFAFNLERAAQSYYGSVGCVSGPLGMYKLECLKEILYEWKEQTFLGKPCTFGDDRRLTALLLRRGYSIYYTHRAVCYTETPTIFSRWIQQQSRWGRSYIREFLLYIPYFYRSSWYLVYDSCHLFFYSCFLFALTVKLLLEIEFHSIIYIIGASLVVAGTRAVYGMILERDPIFLLFSFFGLLYFLFLLPSKLWSALTIGVNSWGTSGRRLIKITWIDCWPIIPWIGFVLYGVVRSAREYDFSKFPLLAWVCIAGTGLISILSVIIFVVRKKSLYSTEERLSEDTEEATEDARERDDFPNRSVLEIMEE